MTSDFTVTASTNGMGPELEKSDSLQHWGPGKLPYPISDFNVGKESAGPTGGFVQPCEVLVEMNEDKRRRKKALHFNREKVYMVNEFDVFSFFIA